MIFTSKDRSASLATAGGKGYSLIRMSQAGFLVPEFIILSTDFFRDWIDKLDGISELRMQPGDPDNTLQDKIAGLQQAAGKLELAPAHKQLLTAKLNEIPGPPQLFSVRSSSPEEDLEGASFAGIYETYLGVRPEEMETYVRKVFLSSIDMRVVTYKRKNRFDFTKYSIAVVIQKQIMSHVAGVGFSVNPLNNCFDEVVINANFGVGESVVSGETVPDQFVVEKHTGRILSRKTGNKRLAILVRDDGGTEAIKYDADRGATLGDGQVTELSDMIRKVEGFYGKPVDTEWALADGAFYLLQARPITTCIPLHPSLQTQPGAPKILYLDLTLVEQGIQKPLSVMGTDCFGLMTNYMGVSATGENIALKPDDMIYAIGGRAYVNLSKSILLEGREGIAREFEGLDSYAAQVIRDADLKEYKAHYTMAGAWLTMKAMFKALFRSRDTIAEIIKGMKHPADLRKLIDAKGKEFIVAMDALEKEPLCFAEFANTGLRRVADLMVHVTIPSLVDGEMSKAKIKQLFKKQHTPELDLHLDKIDQGLPYNVTIAMTCRMYDLAQLLPPADFGDPPGLELKIRNGRAGKEFMSGWNAYMRDFGFRGPREIDIATPRYADEPAILLNQMKNFASVAESESPRVIFNRQQAAREAAFEMLKKVAPNKKRFEQLYDILVNLGGYREIHKYYLVYLGHKIRRKALEIGARLTQEERLAQPGDIFNLTVAQVQQTLDEKIFDVRKAVDANMEYMAQVRNIDAFPPVIDSRGKILRPKRKALKPGELMGDPVSAGIARGPARLLNYVGEKEIRKGDILVAKAADPGWTPLFLNAQGILLEVGGMLQHGSLIAREYGKPCIAGIEDLMEHVKDGDQLEMNGATGLVRIIPK